MNDNDIAPTGGATPLGEVLRLPNFEGIETPVGVMNDAGNAWQCSDYERHHRVPVQPFGLNARRCDWPEHHKQADRNHRLDPVHHR